MAGLEEKDEVTENPMYHKRAPPPGLSDLPPITPSAATHSGRPPLSSARSTRSSRFHRQLHTFKRALSGLNIGSPLNASGSQASSQDGADGSKRVFCFRNVVSWRSYLKVMMTLAAVLVPISIALGITMDLVFFSESIFYTWSLLLWWGLFPWVLLAARYAVLIKYKGSRRAEELSDFVLFLVFFVVLHVGAADILDIKYQFDLKNADPSYLLSSRLRDMVVEEEFLETDSHIYKSLHDIGSVEEFWQYLEGPFVENIMKCENDEEPIPVPGFPSGVSAAMGIPCVIGDNALSHADQIRISTLRVRKQACGYALANMQDPDLKGCLGEFSDISQDKAPWKLKVDPADHECSIFLGLQSQDPTNPTLNWTDGSYLNYRQEQKAGVPVLGQFRQYPPGGYQYLISHRFGANMLEFGSREYELPGVNQYNPFDWASGIPKANFSTSAATDRKRKILRCLRDAQFVDDRTRMVLVEAPIFAQHINKFVLFQIVFEFTSSGRITTRFIQYMGRIPAMSCYSEYIARPWGWPHGNCEDNPICNASHKYHMGAANGMKPGDYKGQCPGSSIKPDKPPPDADSIDRYAYDINLGNYESGLHWNETRWRFGLSLPYVTRNYHITLVLLGFCVYFLIVELEEVFESGIQVYSQSFWNIWDLLVIVFFLVAFVFDTFQKLATPALVIPGQYTEWVPSVFYYQICKQFVALTTIFAWVKWLKYFEWIDSLRFMSRTLSYAGGATASFAALFIVILLGFSFAFYMLESEQLDAYRTIPMTVFTLSRSLLGDYDYDTLVERGSPVSPFLGILYAILAVFILFTMLIAVIDDAFMQARGTSSETHSKGMHVRWLEKVGPPKNGASANLRIVLFNAEGIAIGDLGTSNSDPYIKVSLKNSSEGHSEGQQPLTLKRAHRTKTELRTLDPTFNERVALECLPDDSQVILNLFDEDLMSADEFLGQCAIDLDKLPGDGTVVHLVLKWKRTDNHIMAKTRRPRASGKPPSGLLSQGKARRRQPKTSDSGLDEHLSYNGDFVVQPRGCVHCSVSFYSSTKSLKRSKQSVYHDENNGPLPSSFIAKS